MEGCGGEGEGQEGEEELLRRRGSRSLRVSWVLFLPQLDPTALARRSTTQGADESPCRSLPTL